MGDRSGKDSPGRDYIQMVAKFIKEITDNAPVVYGGGLKQDNAEMLASIPEIDGGPSLLPDLAVK